MEIKIAQKKKTGSIYLQLEVNQKEYNDIVNYADNKSVPLGGQVMPNEVLASGRYIDSWFIIFFPPDSNVPQMTSNIANKKIANLIADKMEKEGHIIIRVDEIKKIYASWREA